MEEVSLNQEKIRKEIIKKEKYYQSIPFVLVSGGLLCLIGIFTKYGILSLILGGILVWLGLKWHIRLNNAVTSETKRRKRQLEERLKESRRQEELNQQQEQNQRGKNHDWLFPAEEFYNMCERGNATDLSNEYSMIKATNYAKQLIAKENPKADISYFSDYLEREKLQSFINLGKLKAQETAEVENTRKKTAQCANPTPVQAALLKRAFEVQYLTGCNKRVKMLTDLADDCQSEYQKAKNEENAWMQLATLQGMQQKNEKDWAIRAGAANGIAGPVAGMATILDTMQENEKIRVYNQDVRNTADGYVSKAVAAFDGQAKAEAERNRLEKCIEEAKTIITLPNPDADTLWGNMKVNYGNAFISKSKSGVLNISMDIRLLRPVHLDVPDGVKMVIDGTIFADVMYENNKIGEVVFLLPILGMPCDEPATVTLKGLCKNSNGFDNGYTLEMKKEQNLWVMEAASKDSVRAVERFFELYRPGETPDQCSEKHEEDFDRYEYDRKKKLFNSKIAESGDMATRIKELLMSVGEPMTLSDIAAVVGTSSSAETRTLMDPAIEAGLIKRGVQKGRVVYMANEKKF